MDSFVLKISGKAELPKGLSIGHNVKTILEGSIISETVSDNDDGFKTHTYLLKPIIVETIDEKGERVRAKDTRSRSTQLRSLIFKLWRQENSPVEFDDFYDEQMLQIMNQIGNF